MNNPRGQLIDLYTRTLEVARSDRITLALYGSAGAEEAFVEFTKRHRLLPIFQNKSFGAALFRIPEQIDSYLTGKQFEYARRQRRKALKAGLHFREFVAVDYADSIVEINRSLPERQGQRMPADHTNKRDVKTFCRNAGKIYGVFDEKDNLKAYTHAPVLGDIFVFSRILGHADSLDKGIMYLLVTEVTIARARGSAEAGFPTWSMYDMYWGASPGLRYFKRRLGFRPYRVKWRYRGRT